MILPEIKAIYCLSDAMAYLFFYYFIFDFNYPGRFKQCLGFFYSFIFKFEQVDCVKNKDILEIQDEI